MAETRDESRLAQLISSNIQKLSYYVTEIQRLVDQIGSEYDSDQLRRRLTENQHTAHTMAKETNRMLHQLADANSKLPPDQARQAKLQQDRLTNDFSTVLNNFQSLQRAAAKKEKDSVLRARANSGLAGNPFADDGKDAFAGGQPLPDQESQLGYQIEQDLNVETIYARENAVRQLEADILDVNQIFKDLAVMVHEQGEIVDSIEANVETAQVQVNQAAVDITSARKYQRSARKKKIICFTISVVALVVLILIIYFSIPKN